MKLLVANHSGYPADSTAAALRAQEESGADIVTDGMVHWVDPLSSPAIRLAGVRLGKSVELGGIAGRCRVPVIEARLRRRRSLVTGDFVTASKHAHKPVKAVLTGPYTLARIAHIATTAYRDKVELARDFSAMLAHEVVALSTAGATLIQVNEPLLLEQPGDVRLLRELLEPLQTAAGTNTRLMIATYGRDAASVYAQLNSLPGDVIALDCRAGHEIVETIASVGAGKILALGLAGVSTSPGNAPADLARLAERLLRRYEFDEVFLQPRGNLASCSPAAAAAVVRNLHAARRLLAP